MPSAGEVLCVLEEGHRSSQLPGTLTIPRGLGSEIRRTASVGMSKLVNRSPVEQRFTRAVAQGYWIFAGTLGILRNTGQRTRSILLATEFSTSVDRLTWLTGFNRSLSTTQLLTFIVAVTIPFFRQDPFNFNVEISVSCNLCRYLDLAGFRPRTERNASGSPAAFQIRASPTSRIHWQKAKGPL
ncbi:hypothetical protein PHLH5_44730 [Pseudomonas sp. Cab53]|nr:hypothetical protein PHLH5_44730 [Pseudomonas sp. Cab53]